MVQYLSFLMLTNFKGILYFLFTEGGEVGSELILLSKRGKMCASTLYRACSLICLAALVGLQAPGWAATPDEKVKENIAQLIKTKNCPGCNLSGAELNRMDLSGGNLKGADLSGAKLFLTNLSGANLQQARLQGASFGGADLSGADLQGADLRGTDFNGAYLNNAKFDEGYIKSKPQEEDSTQREGVTNEESTAYSIKSDKKLPNNISRKEGIKKASPAGLKKAEQTSSLDTEDQIDLTKKNKKRTDENAHTNSPNRKEIPTDTMQAQLTAPPIKTVQPIQKVVIDEKGESGKNNTKISGSDKNDDLQQPEKKGIPANGSQEGEKSGDAGDHNVVKMQDLSLDRKKNEEPSPAIIASQPAKAVVEKNILVEKPVEKEKTDKPSLAQPSDISSLKSNNLKKLLDSKKCYQCDLAGVDLSGKDLENADLEGVDLTGSNLEKTDLTKANLKGAKLINANLKKAKLKGADLYKANLSGADLTDSKMEKAQVDDAIFVGVIGKHP
jgi:uncharacterized protein YjbI with pentapeptide repeats